MSGSFFESLPLWLNLALFAAGLAVIAKGADWFTDGAVRIARATGVPKVIVGATVVSLATTLPEFSVSSIAASMGRPATSVGNAVGSTICNIGLILAAAALIDPVRISRRAVRTDGLTMLGLGAVLLAMAWNGWVGRWEGALLLLSMVVFLAVSVRRSGWSGNAPGGSGEPVRWGRTLRLFLAGGVLVVGGSVLLVQNAVSIARAMGVPELVIALTLVAVGTSLPELITAVASSRRGHGDIAVGNVMGANILNISWVVGGAAVISPLGIERQTLVLDFPVMLAMMGLFLVATGWRGGLGRVAGAVSLGAYVAYLAAMWVFFV